eukprot:237996-Pyramimonas_sp.AAC.1
MLGSCRARLVCRAGWSALLLCRVGLLCRAAVRVHWGPRPARAQWSRGCRAALLGLRVSGKTARMSQAMRWDSTAATNNKQTGGLISQ